MTDSPSLDPRRPRRQPRRRMRTERDRPAALLRRRAGSRSSSASLIVVSLAREAWTFVTEVDFGTADRRRLVPAARACTTSRRSSSAALIVTVIAMVVAVPIGLGAAIYLSEYATPAGAPGAQADPRDPGRHPERRARLLRPHVHLARARPAVLQRRHAVQPARRRHRRRASSPSRSSPRSPRTRCGRSRTRCGRRRYGMGARKITTVVRVVIPAAVSGLVAAFIVAISRAIGETMVVFIAAGADRRLAVHGRPARAGPDHDRGHGGAVAGSGTDQVAGRRPRLPEPVLRRAAAVPHHPRRST